MSGTPRKDNKDVDSYYKTATKVIGVVGAIGAAVSLFYDTATTVIGIAGAVGAVVGLLSWIGSGSKEKGPEDKMMKAPGKDGHIIRKDFQNNPKDYFKDLRGKK